MLLATSRICARPVTFNSNFDKYNGKERPEGDIVFSNVLQSPTGSVGNSNHFSTAWRLPSMDSRTIGLGLLRISRPSEVLERIYGGFPLLDPLDIWVEVPYLV